MSGSYSGVRASAFVVRTAGAVSRRRRDERRIDLYRHGCFILEAKQGANRPAQIELFAPAAEAVRRQAIRNSPGWAQHMLRARGQAEGYVRDLPSDEPAPPFLIVCDVGFCFDLYADFSGTGRHYAQFPDREGFRVYLGDLRRPEIRDRLVAIWNDPHALDPARRRTEVTREIAEYLARLGAHAGGAAHAGGRFLFPQALPVLHVRAVRWPAAGSDGFHRRPAATVRKAPEKFVRLVGELWEKMDRRRLLVCSRRGGAAVQWRSLRRGCRDRRAARRDSG